MKSKSLVVLILVVLVTIFYSVYNLKTDDKQIKPIKPKRSKTLAEIVKNINSPTKPIVAKLKKLTPSFDSILENYLIHENDKVDDSGTDWKEIRENWLRRLTEHLEDRFNNKKLAQQKVTKYLELKMEFQSSEEVEKAYLDLNIAKAKMLSLKDNPRMLEEDKKYILTQFEDAKKKIRDLKSKHNLEIQKIFGKNFNEVLGILDKYNKETSQNNVHLGYKINLKL